MTSLLKLVSLALVLTATGVSWADVVGDSTGSGGFYANTPAGFKASGEYRCHVVVTAKDLPDGSADSYYTAAKTTTGHAGKSYPFTVQNHQISTVTDSRWMGIVWSKGGVVIARQFTARADDMEKPQVLTAYNPQDDDEQVSLDCAPTTAP